MSSKKPIPLLQSLKSAPKVASIEPVNLTHPLSMFKEPELSLGLLDRAEPSKQRPVPVTDRSYKNEIDTDMQELKKKNLGRDIKKDSKKEGSNMANKIFAPMMKKQKKESNI